MEISTPRSGQRLHIVAFVGMLSFLAPAATTASILGDRIAAGLGLASSTPSLFSSGSYPSTTGPVGWSNSTSPSGYATGPASGRLRSGYSSGTFAPAGTGTGYRWSNASITGDCWDQWDAYWTASESASAVYTTETTATLTTTRTPTYFATTDVVMGPTTVTIEWTEYAGGNSNFPVGVETQIETAGGDLTGLSYIPTSTGKPITETSTTEYVKWIYSTNTVMTPACTLPSIVPQCQSQWDEWLAYGAARGVDEPICQAASINSRACNSLISERFAGNRAFGATNQINGFVTEGTSTFWPTSESFAAGCTLGCQTCAITGNTVQVYYWPSTTATAVENGTMTARPSQLVGAGSGNRTASVIAIVGNATLTSPTIYISYKSLYASNSCSQVGRRYSNTIIPLANNKDLHSLAYHQLDDMPLQPGDSGSGPSWDYEELPFNLTDLVEPIPDSIYDKMPRCQSSLAGYITAGFTAKNFHCSHFGPYAPLIAMPAEVHNVDPEWASCTVWYGGLYDPPKALQGTAIMATPTTPNVVESTSASAGSTANAGLPSKTAGGQPSTGAGAEPAKTSASAADLPGSASSTTSSSGVDPASSQTNTADPTLGASTQVVSIAAVPTGDYPDPADPSSGQDADPATSLQATTNALSVLAAALTLSAKGADPAVGTNLPAAETVLTLSLPGPAGQEGATAEAPGTNSPSLVSISKGQTATVSRLGIVIAQSSGLVVAGSTVPYSNVQPQATQNPASVVFTAGEQTYTAYQASGTASALSVEGGGSTVLIDPGSSAIMNGETAVADSGGVVFGSQTVAFPQPTASAGAITVSSQAFTVASQAGDPSAVIVANGGSTVTLTAGSAAATLGGQVVSAAESEAAVIGTGSEAQTFETMQSLAQDPAGESAVLTIGGETITATAASHGLDLIYGHTTKTLSAGGAAFNLGTQLVSAGGSGQLIAGSSTVTLPPAQTAQPSGILLTLGSYIATASRIPGQPNVIVVDDNTLSAGGPAETIGGQLVSAGISGQLVAGSRTFTLDPASPSGVLLTLGSSTITASEIPGHSGAVVIDGSTLSAGGAAETIDGQIVSVGSSGLVVDGSATVSLPQVTFAAQSGVVLTLGGSEVTATAVAGQNGEVVIESTTLSVGGPAYTMSGELISEASGGLVVGGSTTIALSRITTSPRPTSSQANDTDRPEALLPSSTTGVGSVVRAGQPWLVALAILAALFSI